MEELQSTDILDSEILEDARKKAWRILKAADETVLSQAGEWEKKTRESLEELRQKYLKRRKTVVSEIVARLPIDKRRVRTQAIDRLLNNAVQTWYAELKRERVIMLIKNQLKKRLAESHDILLDAGKVFYSNLAYAEVENIISDGLKGINFSFEEIISDNNFPELVIDNDAVRISASLQKAVDYFLQEKRAELIEALVGTEIPDGETFGTLQGAREEP